MKLGDMTLYQLKAHCQDLDYDCTKCGLKVSMNLEDRVIWYCGLPPDEPYKWSVAAMNREVEQ